MPARPRERDRRRTSPLALAGAPRSRAHATPLLYVYGFCRRAVRTPRTTGIAGEPLRLASAGRLAAVVGDVRRAPSLTRRNLQAHQRVTFDLWVRIGGFLPARFGASVGSEDELRGLLQSQSASLARSLQAIRHRAQMTVRVFGASSLQSAVPQSELDRAGSRPTSRPVATGADYLRARAAASAVRELDPLREAVRRWVREERVERQAGIVSLYHLVPRSAVEDYRRAATRWAVAAGVRIVVSGPWPGYAFVEVESRK